MPRSNNNSAPTKFTTRPGSALIKPSPSLAKPVHVPVPVERATPTLGQTIKEGFGFGIGTSIARNMVDRIFAPTHV